MHDQDDVSRMLRVKEGDTAAFEELVERHRDRVLGLVYRYVRDRAEAEDLAQDVFLNVFKARETYRPDARFTTWLYRIATNLCLNALRSKRVRRVVKTLAPVDGEESSRPIEDLADPSPAPAGEALEKRELASRVREVVDELPESQRTAVLLNKYEDRSYVEISEIMGLSIPAVKSLLSRARMRIKERLLPYLQSERVI